MNYKTLNEYKQELHPWEPYVPVGAKRLILGTFPTAEDNRGAYEFFYPNPNNDFWRLIFRVAGKDLQDFLNGDQVAIRKTVLSDLEMGIADIGKSILRQKDSSKDESLFPIEYTNVLLLLENNPGIRKIIVTSSSGTNSVLSWFHHYCELNKFKFNIPKGKLPRNTVLHFKNRVIRIDIISSPSRLSPIKGDPLFQMYRKAILDIP